MVGRTPARRAVWLLPLTTTIALVCALAAFGATTRSSAAPTLVVDNSFTIKTSDPQRAFDPTASIIDRAIFDTLFTYNKGDLANPIPLLVESWKAAKGDKAEQWFNSSASVGAGSGPYTLKAYSTTSQLTLAPNPKYWGAKKPAFGTVVVRNMIAPTQLINVQRGSHEVAIDLSADQAQTLKGNSKLRVSLQPSTWVFWLFTNNNPSISAVTSNKQFQTAVRYALDYKSIVSVAGPGAIQAPGIIPSMFLGALPQKNAIKQDLPKAKAALAASGAGSQEVTLEYPSDLTINGVPFGSMAQKVQANLKDAGFNIALSGSPTSNWLTKYRDGQMA